MSKYSWRLAAPRLRFVLLAIFTIIAIVRGSATNAAETALPVASVVDSEGRLHLPEGYVGSVNVDNYALYTDTHGEPRFFPSSTAAQIPVLPLWAGFGEVRHGCDRQINAMVRMPNGDLILGGNFTACGNAPSPAIVRWDGKRWSALGTQQVIPAGALNGIYALALRGNDLFAGGDAVFETVEGARISIARWDGTAWHSLDDPNCQGCDFDGPILALSVIGTDVYAGGSFNGPAHFGGPQTYLHNIGRWDGSAWHGLVGTTAVGCDPSQPGVDDVVNALTNDGSNLYVGGSFSRACAVSPTPGVIANYVARWDGTTWASVGSDSENGVNGPVAALAYNSGSVYVGGAFDLAGSTTAHSLARWDGTAWQSVGVGADNGVSGPVSALRVFSGQLYVGGGFRVAGSISAVRIARWNGSTWSAMASGLGMDTNSDTSTINAIVADSFGITAAGSMTSIPGVDTANGVAQWSGSSWLPLVSTGDFTMIDGRVNAFGVRGNELFVGGAITRVGEIPVNNVARWDGIAWSSMGTGVDGEVFAISTTPNNVYVGGEFAHAGGQTANRIARWNASTWQSMGSGTDGPVYAIAANSDTSVYVGGSFIHAGNSVTNSIARWNASNWNALPLSNGLIGICGTVLALAPYQNGVYVGGHFPATPCAAGSGVPGNNIAYWSGTGWSTLHEAGALRDGVSPAGGGSAQVNALLVQGLDLYVGGSFSEVDTASGVAAADGVVRWRSGAWNIINGGEVSKSSGVYALGTLGEKVYAATDIAEVVVYDETNRLWAKSGAGPNFGVPYVTALATVGPRLYAGGSFFDFFDRSLNFGADLASAAWAVLIEDEIFSGGFGN